MSSQYQSFVRAQMRSREASIRNRYQAEDEKRSRNIAVGELVGKTFMTGLDFRKNMVEQNILGQTTDSDELKYKYKVPEDSLLGNIRRRFAPRTSDFTLTKAGKEQVGRESNAFQVGLGNKKNASALLNTKVNQLESGSAGSNGGIGLQNLGFRSESQTGKETIQNRIGLATGDGTKSLASAKRAGRADSRPSNKYNSQAVLKKSIDSNDEAIYAKQSLNEYAQGSRGGVNPLLTDKKVQASLRGKGTAFDAPVRQAANKLMGKQKPSLDLVNSDIINEIATKTKTSPASFKATTLLKSKGLTSKVLGAAGKGANILNVGMNAKNLLMPGGSAGSAQDKKRFDAAFGLGTAALAATGILGGPLAGGLTLGKMLFDANSSKRGRG